MPEQPAVVWDPNQRGIDYLTSGRPDRNPLERVAPSLPHAWRLVAESRRHLSSAATVVSAGGTDADWSGAFVMAYDAARKALTAVLAAQGLRARGGDGGHTVLLDAVRPQFPDDRRTLQRFDWMRQVRNRVAYPDLDTPTATSDDVDAAIPAAAAIVDLTQRYLDWISD